MSVHRPPSPQPLQEPPPQRPAASRLASGVASTPSPGRSASPTNGIGGERKSLPCKGREQPLGKRHHLTTRVRGAVSLRRMPKSQWLMPSPSAPPQGTEVPVVESP
jgi:hypothetical protein